jgi:hypothetical protein
MYVEHFAFRLIFIGSFMHSSRGSLLSSPGWLVPRSARRALIGSEAQLEEGSVDCDAVGSNESGLSFQQDMFGGLGSTVNGSGSEPADVTVRPQMESEGFREDCAETDDISEHSVSPEVYCKSCQLLPKL